MFDNSNKGWLTKFIGQVVVDVDTVEDEVVEVEAAIVEHVLSKIVLVRIVVCTNTIKKTKQSLNLQVHNEASRLKKEKEK